MVNTQKNLDGLSQNEDEIMSNNDWIDTLADKLGEQDPLIINPRSANELRQIRRTGALYANILHGGENKGELFSVLGSVNVFTPKMQQDLAFALGYRDGVQPLDIKARELIVAFTPEAHRGARFNRSLMYEILKASPDILHVASTKSASFAVNAATAMMTTLSPETYWAANTYFSFGQYPEGTGQRHFPEDLQVEWMQNGQRKDFNGNVARKAYGISPKNFDNPQHPTVLVPMHIESEEALAEYQNRYKEIKDELRDFERIAKRTQLSRDDQNYVANLTDEKSTIEGEIIGVYKLAQPAKEVQMIDDYLQEMVLGSPEFKSILPKNASRAEKALNGQMILLSALQRISNR